MIRYLEIVRPYKAEKEQKEISEYLNANGLISSVAISSALKVARASYDTRKVTNMMDRLRDFIVASPRAQGMGVYQSGSVKYWYPACMINTYLVALGLPDIPVEVSNYGIFTDYWFNQMGTHKEAPQRITFEYISLCNQNRKIIS